MPDRRQGDRRDTSIKQVSIKTFILSIIAVIILLVLAITFFIVCQNKINQSYQEGYNAGYNEGYKSGYSEGSNVYVDSVPTYELVNPESTNITASN